MPNVAATKAGQINAWACGATNLVYSPLSGHASMSLPLLGHLHCKCTRLVQHLCIYTRMNAYIHMAATCVLVAQTVSRVIIKTVQHCCKSGYINFRLLSSLKCTKTQPRREACPTHTHTLSGTCLVAHQTKFLFYLLISQRHFFQALKAICWEFSEM